MNEIGLHSASNDETAVDDLHADVAEFLRLLDVTTTGENQFRGIRKRGGVGRVFGGQVVAQALSAAMKTVDPARQVHSLHAYFMRPGSEDHEIDYLVEADFDGGSFSNRRVVASQLGKPILNLTASFQIQENGYFHQTRMPDVPPPEECETFDSYVARQKNDDLKFLPALLKRFGPFDRRVVGIPPFCQMEPLDSAQAFWFRIKTPIADEQFLHRTIVAYVSDLSLISAAVRRHGRPELKVASLDHAIWFHDDMRTDDWLLYSTESPWAGQARGLARGMIFDRSGKLVASVAQEGLLRPLREEG